MDALNEITLLQEIPMTTVVRLIILFALTFGAALLGAAFTTSDTLSTWYAGLHKPPFNPPSWVFGPVWTILYCLMAVSALLIWQKGLDNHLVRLALVLFLLQLALNALWTPLFFGLKMPTLALLDIIVLWLAVALTILTFAKISAPAALLLVPYILWVTFAVVLNAAICLLNRG
jgi:tryptophan-rich sensory protein